MRRPSLSIVPVALATLALLAGAPAAQGVAPEPGSVLVYPSVRGSMFQSTLISVTNTSPIEFTSAKFRYVATVPSTDPFLPTDCLQDDIEEFLSPSDTLSVLTACHTSLASLDGYLVVDAVLPGGPSWSHNHLIGSQLVVFGTGVTFSLPAIPIRSPVALHNGTDLDFDLELDFDGIEYQQLPAVLYLDSFLASIGTNLTLINLTGGTAHTATAAFTVFNDNEIVFSAARDFRCWFDQPLDTISLVFSSGFLLGTPDDPTELDADCDGVGDFETGWVSIRGIVADSGSQAIPMPAFLGAVTTSLSLERGRPLWGEGTNPNGDFLGTVPVHPEF